MKKRLVVYWILSCLPVIIVSFLLTKTWFCKNENTQGEFKSFLKSISPTQSMGNDIKWTRYFRAADGSIFFEDHRMSRDGGRTIIDQNDIDVEDINGAPERAVLVQDDVFYALDGPTTLVSPGVYSAKAWRSSNGIKTIQEEQVTINVPDGPLRDGINGEWYGIFVYRTIIEMPDGTWLMTMYGNFASDTIFPPDEDAQRELTYMQRTFIVTSNDEGRTWDYLSAVASPSMGKPVGEGFVEPAITLLQDGRLLCIMGSGHRFPLYASWSEDGELSWVNQKIMERSGTCYSTIMEVEPNVVFMLVNQLHCRITVNKRGTFDTLSFL